MLGQRGGPLDGDLRGDEGGDDGAQRPGERILGEGGLGDSSFGGSCESTVSAGVLFGGSDLHRPAYSFFMTPRSDKRGHRRGIY